MAINTGVKKMHDMVDRVVNRIQNIEAVCKNAKANLGTDYSHVISIPAVTARFIAEITDMASNGYTVEVLGPIMDASYGTDWVNEKADYDQLKIDLPILSQWIIDNASLFVHTMNANGDRLYNTPIDSTKEAELLALIDTVLPRFN